MSKYNYDNLYILREDMPGFEAGTIFQHRKHDNERNLGSPACGYLTNIWIEGDCQNSKDYIGWCAETHILPGQLKDDTKWFQPVEMIGKDKGRVHVVKGMRFREVDHHE